MRTAMGSPVRYREINERVYCEACSTFSESVEPSSGRIANAALELLERVERSIPAWTEDESIDVHEMRMAARDLRRAINEEMGE